MEDECHLKGISFLRVEAVYARFTARFTFVLLLLAIGLFLVACKGRPTPAGYWEGKGTAMETPMDDAVRKLTRSADFDFWFVLDKDGNAVGEIELIYDAELKVENLPNVTVPAPGGNITFAPEVGGKLTDLNPRRRFPLVGAFDGERLILGISVPEKDRKPLEFTLRADPGVSGGLAISGIGVGVPGRGAGTMVRKIPMRPFSPFGEAVPVDKRPGGPFAIRYEDEGENYAINWSARQMGGEQRNVEITPEMELELRRLREKLRL